MLNLQFDNNRLLSVLVNIGIESCQDIACDNPLTINVCFDTASGKPWLM